MNKTNLNTSSIAPGGCITPSIDESSFNVLSLIKDRILKSVGYVGHSETTTQPGWDDTEVRPVVTPSKNDDVVTETKETKSFLSLFGYLGRSDTTTQPSWDSNDEDSYSVGSNSSTHSVKDDASTHSVNEESKLEVYDSIEAALGEMG